MSYYYDENLNPLLDKLTDDELKPITKIISEKLSADIDEDCTDRAQIADEILRYGSNTFALDVKPYRKIVLNVAKALKVEGIQSYSSLETLEEKIIANSVNKYFNEMTQEQRKQVIEEMQQNGLKVEATKIRDFITGSNVNLVALLGAEASGFLVFKGAVIAANIVAKSVGMSLTLAGNAAITKTLGVIIGPVGWVLTGIWTAVDLGSASMKVCVPVVIYLSAMRQAKENAQ